jgi:hypothetical protein
MWAGVQSRKAVKPASILPMSGWRKPRRSALRKQLVFLCDTMALHSHETLGRFRFDGFALAIISEPPLPMRDMLKPEDEVIQTSTVSDALRQLITSRNPRKVIIVTTNADIESVPSIQVVHSGPAEVFKVVIELRNQYLLRFRSSDPSARVELTLKQPSGLPLLKPIWKAPF